MINQRTALLYIKYYSKMLARYVKKDSQEILNFHSSMHMFGYGYQSHTPFPPTVLYSGGKEAEG